MSVLFAPQKAKAFLGFGDITIDIVNQIKDWIVDALPKSVARSLMVRLQQEVARWAQGGFSDENKPFAMTSWKKEVSDALNIAGGRFIQEFDLTPLCSPIKVSLNTALGLGFNQGGTVPYSEYAACTIGDIVDNVEEFFENPSIALYGWDTWTALAQPNNNFVGSFLMAQKEKERIAAEEILEKEKEIQVGQGYKNDGICNQTQQDACVKNCDDTYESTLNGLPNPFWVDCMKTCEKSPLSGVCLEKQTTKLGSEVKTSLDKMIGSDIDWLISADEITEMLNLVFSGLFNKLINGTGLSLKPTSSSLNNQYSYYKSYKKTQTPEDLKKLRTDIANNILDNAKRLTTSAYECDTSYQLKGDVYNDVANEILDQESQHLYTTIEGVDLKPDFIVLDSFSAVENKIAIYGTTWRDIPLNKYPDACQKIANKKCKDISSGLPYNVELENINSECTTGCLGQINVYRTQKKTDTEAINLAVADKKCSSFNVGNQCVQGDILIYTTKNRCDECLSAQETCESKTDPIQKKSCIESHCNNYEGISTSITSPSDFYNKCSTLQTKDFCYICLKEYFMPADYCGEIYDYINQGFVKYPALVYENTWWGRHIKFTPPSEPDCILENLLLTHGSPPSSYIPTGLTCRIMPDFVFPNTGGKTCMDYCKTTEEELKDISDHEPQDSDCNGPSIDPLNPEWGGAWKSGGAHPGGQWVDYLIRKKAKCCAALLGHVPESYKACRGIEEGEVIAESSLSRTCAEGERLINETATSWDPKFICPNGQECLVSSEAGTCRKGCASSSFEVPKTENAKNIRITTNPAPGGSVITVSKSGCSDKDEATCVAGGGSIIPCDYIGELPSGIICQTESYNSRNSTHCCTDGEHGLWQLGATTMDCDLSAYKGETVYLSVVSNQASDCKTTAGVCVPCDPNDPGYPNYGYDTNQCK